MQSQLGLDPSAEYFRIDWLDHEIISARIETCDLVLAMSGQHDHWNLGHARLWIGPQTAQRLRAIQFWHHEIEQKDCWLLPVHELQRVTRIVRFASNATRGREHACK